jgi:hypothetical protein
MTNQNLNAPSGWLFNGKISVTVSSNNLTVAIKTMDGSDPSSTNVVEVRIGNTVRTITAALSVTANAATDWFGSGGTGFATVQRRYHVYLGYNATDGVVIGFSPFSPGEQYSDFSTTATDAMYAKISTITNAASTDDYVLVGRFEATLSAGAGYTWTVPTFAPNTLVQRPMPEDSGTWTTTPVNTTNVASSTAYLGQYTRIGRIVTGSLGIDIDPTATGAVVLNFSLPYPSNFTSAVQLSGSAANTPGASPDTGLSVYADPTNNNGAIGFLAATTNARQYRVIFQYLII